MAIFAMLLGCTPPARMCVSSGDCGASSSCVAGRCVAHGAVPAIATARRVLVDPVSVGYVSRSGGGGPRSVARLGAGDGAIALLRFSLALPLDAEVVEAYLLIDRAADIAANPVPIALHVARVTSPWDEQSLSWETQPRVEEIGAPVTRVSPAAGRLVRLDVRDLVARWRRRSRDDVGLAIVADGERGAGIAFVLAPRDPSDVGPELELYLK